MAARLFLPMGLLDSRGMAPWQWALSRNQVRDPQGAIVGTFAGLLARILVANGCSYSSLIGLYADEVLAIRQAMAFW
jgi:hypothetical protein